MQLAMDFTAAPKVRGAGEPGVHAPGWDGPDHCAACHAETEARCAAFEAAVARGEYDAQGYTPAERRALQRVTKEAR